MGCTGTRQFRGSRRQTLGACRVYVCVCVFAMCVSVQRLYGCAQEGPVAAPARGGSEYRIRPRCLETGLSGWHGNWIAATAPWLTCRSSSELPDGIERLSVRRCWPVLWRVGCSPPAVARPRDRWSFILDLQLTDIAPIYIWYTCMRMRKGCSAQQHSFSTEYDSSCGRQAVGLTDVGLREGRYAKVS